MRKSLSLTVKATISNTIEERIETCENALSGYKNDLANMVEENPDLDKNDWAYVWRDEEVEKLTYEIRVWREILEKL